MERNSPADPILERLQKLSLCAGMVALGLCAIGAAFDIEQFFRSYLVAYLFWIGIALGCLTIVMMHSLTGGAWGVVTRRMLEAGAQTIGLMAVLFVPLALGARHLYGWLEAGAHAADRHPYLNAPFFFFRAALYFGCWLLLVYFLTQWSRERDEKGDSKSTRNIRLLSAPGLVLYVITATFASIDWVMSIEPHWRSTIFGVLFMGGQVLSACAFVIVVAALLARRQPLADRITSEHFHDLGNLLLSFVMLWAYFAFSQYLIIWSGNLPDEISWYLRRSTGGWESIGMILIAFHFLAPFLLLLSRAVKRRVGLLSAVATGVLLMRWLDLVWSTAPAFHRQGIFVHWMDAMAPIAIGGLWLALYIFYLQSRELLPVHGSYGLRGDDYHGRV